MNKWVKYALIIIILIIALPILAIIAIFKYENIIQQKELETLSQWMFAIKPPSEFEIVKTYKEVLGRGNAAYPMITAVLLLKTDKSENDIKNFVAKVKKNAPECPDEYVKPEIILYTGDVNEFDFYYDARMTSETDNPFHIKKEKGKKYFIIYAYCLGFFIFYGI